MNSSLISECENWIKNPRSPTPELDKEQKRIRVPKRLLAKAILVKDAHERNIVFWHLRAFMIYLGGNHMAKLKTYCAANDIDANGEAVEIRKPEGLCFLIRDGTGRYLDPYGKLGPRSVARRILESDVRSVLDAAQLVFQNYALEVECSSDERKP